MKIIQITKKKPIVTVDLEVESTHSYQLQNGVVTHNTASLVLGTSSGIHAWHSKYYIRRIRIGKHESIYKYILNNNHALLEDDKFDEKTSIISIPIKAPNNSIKRSDETSLQLLNRVKHISKEWIQTGHKHGDNTHNVSVTVSVKDDEWKTVGDWMWENRDNYNGIAVLPYDGGTYVQAPFEEISEEKYNELLLTLKDINFDNIKETTDNTEHTQEVACASGKCEI